MSGRAIACFVNGIGDHVLALPALRALCAAFPGRLELVCSERLADTFFAGLPVLALHPHDFARAGRGRTFDARAIAARLAPAEIVVSLNPWHSPAIDELLALLAPRRSIGFFPAFGEELPRDFSIHSADLAFAAARAVDARLRFEDFAEPPAFGADAARAARSILRAIPRDRRVLIVHAETKPEKSWPAERFVAALDEFLDARRDFVALVVGREPSGFDRGRCGDRVVDCAGLPLAVSLALTAHADLFFGVDSCALHVADFARVPCVAIFGPTEPHEFGCRLAPARHLRGPGCEMTEVSVASATFALRDVAARWCAAGTGKS